MPTETQTKSPRGDAATQDTGSADTLGSGDVDRQRETREAAVAEVGEERYYADPERYWTAQQGPLPESGQVAARGPQKYLESQLPDPDIAQAAGVPALEIPENIVLDDEEAWGHPRGPEPGEQIRLVKSSAVRERSIQDASEHPSEAGLFTLTDSSMGEIRQAQESADDSDDHGAEGGGHTHADRRGDSEPRKTETGGSPPAEANRS